MKRAASCAVLALGLCWSSAAHAFSDPAAFADPADAGGGGGRFFTGSPADGYTCRVCHGGGVNPAMLITGLPIAGYAPSTAYEVTIAWRDDVANAALEAEITDASGRAAGSLRLPPDNELLDSELCLPLGSHVGAGTLLDAPGRSVISVPDCGSRRLRFLWIAPSADIGPVWLSGSIVSSDAKGDVKGDGVTDFSRRLPSPSAPDPSASTVRSGWKGLGCSAAPARPARTAALGLPFLLVTLLVWRRRIARLR